MTSQEYVYYSNLSQKLFNYMNGKINNLNYNCTLSIYPYDYRTTTRYAEHRFPSDITLFIGNMVDSWNETWSMYISRNSYIDTMIAWSIAHELHHADQLISTINYNSNPEYRNRMESDVETASHHWLQIFQDDINKTIGTEININVLTAANLSNKNNYLKANAKEFYLQIIANIILKDFDLFRALGVFTNDNLASNIILSFNSIDSVMIKNNGEFIASNIPLFNKLVMKHCVSYDRYSIYVDVSFGYNNSNVCTATVEITIEDKMIYPLRPISV